MLPIRPPFDTPHSYRRPLCWRHLMKRRQLNWIPKRPHLTSMTSTSSASRDRNDRFSERGELLTVKVSTPTPPTQHTPPYIHIQHYHYMHLLYHHYLHHIHYHRLNILRHHHLDILHHLLLIHSTHIIFTFYTIHNIHYTDIPVTMFFSDRISLHLF